MRRILNMTIVYKLVLLSLTLGYVSPLYPSGGDVVELTPSNFYKEVINSDSVWVVEFFAPWCGHCQALVPEYKKAAAALKGVVKVGSVNADEHKSLGGQYGVQGFPTIKIFGLDKSKPESFNGQRTASGIAEAALKTAKEMVSARVSGRKTAGGDRAEGSTGSDVIELTDSNFENLVLKSDDLWLVEFFAPWCGHCKNLAPHWEKAAGELKGKVKLGALDATVNTVKASQYDVHGYPTIKLFHRGDVEDYDGGRTASDIVSWAMDRVTVNLPPPEIVQLTDDSVLDSACNKHSICIISVLPDILDCQSECRNKYIDMLLKLGDKYKQKMWGWVWTEAVAQPHLEDSLDIGGFGYPALAALNAKKMQFALFKGSFSYEGVNEFLRDISYGRGRTAPVKGAKLAKVRSVEPWDGKDGVMPDEEDLDLSDFDLDDAATKEEL